MYIPNITWDILAQWPLLEGQPNCSRIQCLGVWGLELAKTEEKSCLVRNVSSVHVGSSGSLWYMLLGVIWNHLLFGQEKWIFFSFYSLSALRHAMEWLCSQNLLYSFIIVHGSLSWNDFLRTRHSSVNVPTAAVPPFSPKNN